MDFIPCHPTPLNPFAPPNQWVIGIAYQERGGGDCKQVFDFLKYIEEMDEGEGPHCGSQEFQAAYKLAMHRLETDMANPSSPSPVKVKAEKMVATMATIGSARKTTIEEVEYASGYEPAVSELNEKTEGQSMNVDNDAEADNDVEEMAEEEEDRKQLPIKTVEFQEGCGGSVSSPKKPTFSQEDEQSECQSEAFTNKRATSDSNTSVRRKINRCSPAPADDMPWPEMYNHLIGEGWHYVRGTGLIWFIVHPLCKGWNAAKLFSEGKEGVDYVTSEDDLKTYARLHYNWRTDSMKLCSDSPKDEEMTDRIKKRLQQKKADKQAEDATPVVASKRGRGRPKDSTEGKKEQTFNSSKAKK